MEAWTFLQLGARQQEGAEQFQFPHRWAVMFLVAVGFWNFLGAGVFGFLINLPVVSYYEIGTQLTANHGHAAMMGVYGMLAVSLLVFCLRYYLRAGRLERAAGQLFILDAEPWTGVDGVRQPLSDRRTAARRRRHQWLLARSLARVLRSSTPISSGCGCRVTSRSSREPCRWSI